VPAFKENAISFIQDTVGGTASQVACCVSTENYTAVSLLLREGAVTLFAGILQERSALRSPRTRRHPQGRPYEDEHGQMGITLARSASTPKQHQGINAMDNRVRDDDENRPLAKPLTDSTTVAIREALEGRRHGIALLLPFAGPAIVVSVAYVDPGNFATNIQAGARYGYVLLWVVVVANLIAMLFQALAARLGIVTQRNLAELCREHFPRLPSFCCCG
jgi:hypothetical protein